MTKDDNVKIGPVFMDKVETGQIQHINNLPFINYAIATNFTAKIGSVSSKIEQPIIRKV